MKKNRKNILILRFSALGDVAMTIPVIYSLARQYPDLKITVLTKPSFVQLFINNPSNLYIIKADWKGIHKGFIGMIRLFKMLHTYHFDGIADLHNVLRSWLIDVFFLLHGKKVVMVDKQRRSRWKVLFKHARHANYINRYTEVFARLGVPAKLSFCSVYESGLPEIPLKIEHPAIGIAPFARYDNKIYPLEKMQQVVRLLTKQGFHVYFFGGGKRETEILMSWQKYCPGSLSLAGKYSLQEELAIIRHLDVMVTMDSANQHLASLVGRPAISIWGSTTPACGFLGYNQQEGNALCLNLPCQPCTISGSWECYSNDLKCMTGINPMMIIEKIKKWIKEKNID